MKKKMIFGAGFYGRLAFDNIGTNNVEFFIDNDEKKVGGLYCEKKILSPGQAIVYKDTYQVVIASLYADSIEQQLKELGFTDYYKYLGEVHGFYESPELIVNPYLISKEMSSETEWNNSKKIKYARDEVNRAVEIIAQEERLFDHIEVETINRCNGNCSFCPVNRNVDTREKAVMSEKLFQRIVGQLEELKYMGRFTTFSNNEPLLDDRIIDFNEYARNHLPNARMHLYTNGTLLTLDKFKRLIDVLDELIIDNYHQELKLIKPCEQIVEYCQEHPELKSKVSIVLRRPNEILTSRGGDAPNRKELVDYGMDKCLLPFKQMIIRPTGKVSLCCNDALGKYTLGDVSKDSLLDVWYGEQFREVRTNLEKGRAWMGNCRYCDNFSMG